MRIIFMGTAELAAPCLEAVAGLIGHQVVLVITQPDRPKGRSLQLAPPPVKITAERLGLLVSQPVKIREAAAIETIRAAKPDLIVVVAYGQLLPRTLLEIPRYGCINVHTSLLPRWRGASPIQAAILAGDQQTGVTTMYLDELMDHGDIIQQRIDAIQPDDTGATLHDRLAQLGAALLVETVDLIAKGTAPRRPQDEALVTKSGKINKEDGRLDWSLPAPVLERRIRAFSPWPGAYTFVGELLLKVWKVELVAGFSGVPGTLRDGVIAAAVGGLRLMEVQPAGGKRMSFEAFQRGHKLENGLILKYPAE